MADEGTGAASNWSVPVRRLLDGRDIPAIGLGTYAMNGEAGILSVVSGIEAGYRLLDSAMKYGNEAEVGEGIRRSGIDRSDIVLTTKLQGRYHGYEKALEGFELSRRALRVDYVDLYLIHWPLPRLDLYVDSWRALIKLREDGLVKSIGVSNFTRANIERLVAETGVAPVVNQIELHPYFAEPELRRWNAAQGIQTQSWSPLAEGRDLGEELAVRSAAESHGVTAAQVVLRWNVHLGAVPVPRSANPDRQRQNLEIFDFELTEAEIKAISLLDRGRRLWGADPDTYESF